MKLNAAAKHIYQKGMPTAFTIFGRCYKCYVAKVAFYPQGMAPVTWGNYRVDRCADCKEDAVMFSSIVLATEN